MTGGDDRTTVRRVLITIGLVLATLLGLLLVYATRRVLVWGLVAAFFAVALNPAVDWTQRRLARCRRSVATLLVFLLAFGLLGGLTTAIVLPLVRQTAQLADQLPQLIDEVQAGRGPIGGLLHRLHVLDYLRSHRGQLGAYVDRLPQPSITLLMDVASTVVGTITVVVLAYLMVLQAPRIAAGAVPLVPDRHVPRVRRIGRDCARTITGYISGNLLISLICGGLTFLVLVVLGVPYAGVIALIVAITDLIPLVGATLGAVVATGAALMQSTTAAIVTVLFFVVYQQVENHVLQPVILSRTVRLSPLTVLFSILIGVELAGILGALLAIPAAGVVQVVAREVRDQSGQERGPTPADDAAPPVRETP